MRVAVQLDLRTARQWHLTLLERLSGRGITACVVQDKDRPELPARVAALAQLDGALQGSRSTLLGRIAADRFARYAPQGDDQPDLTLQLSGEGRSENIPTWCLRFNGAPSEAALASILLNGDAPVAMLVNGDATVASGRLGTDGHGSFAQRMEDALSRTISLIEGVVLGGRPLVDRPPHEGPPIVAAPPLADIARHSARSVLRLGLRTGYRMAYRSPHWRVGWRRSEGEDLFDTLAHPQTGWASLPDDGQRFYADPFAILHEGQVTLFVEEFPHATQKGIISAVAFDRNGPIGSPEPVLECPYHLSYPFVFARDGAVWMIPESGQAETIDLYRATRFPGGWVKERTLVSGITASDATLWDADGLWWMFATVKDGGSHSDMLCLWSAVDFRGPWTPHPRNPVLIDCAGARPAGAMVRRDGRLFRPVQDCRATYGGALAIAEVTRLDAEGFSQRIRGVLTAGPLWPGRHLHTLNAAGGFEFIDGTGRAPRPWLARLSRLAG